MFPYFMLFDRMITTYFLMSLIGIFAAGLFACRLTRKRGLDDNDTIIVLLFAAIGVIAGGHILYGITNYRLIPAVFHAETFTQFIQAVNAAFGGSVFYGGLIGGILVAYITIRLKKLDLSVFSDMLAVVIPLFHSFARVGCFLGGCCYGIESSFGFVAHGNTLVPAVNDVSRFPVQLLEAFLNLLLFFLLYYIYKKSLNNTALQGKILLLYLICYPVIRFFDEFLRGDEIRGFIFGLSTSQFISIILFSVAAVWLWVLAVKEKRARNQIN